MGGCQSAATRGCWVVLVVVVVKGCVSSAAGLGAGSETAAALAPRDGLVVGGDLGPAGDQVGDADRCRRVQLLLEMVVMVLVKQA